MTDTRKYHLGFGRADLDNDVPINAILCGAPERAHRIAFETEGVDCLATLSQHRGLHSFLVALSGGVRLLVATSGMGAPSTSIVVNELVDLGVRHIVRVGTSGSIQPEVHAGSVVISRAALCRQGAAGDIAPTEYPAAANPFLTVALVESAQALQVDWHIGVTASVDTFYEGQERTESSANKHILRWLQGSTEEYRHLNILNYEMEAGTLLKMGGVYGFAAACVCAVVAERTQSETITQAIRQQAEDNAIMVALRAIATLNPEYAHPHYWR